MTIGQSLQLPIGMRRAVLGQQLAQQYHPRWWWGDQWETMDIYVAALLEAL